jgi:hypothetical protein
MSVYSGSQQWQQPSRACRYQCLRQCADLRVARSCRVLMLLVHCRSVRGETRSRMPFSNRMALGMLAARLVDGGGKPTQVRPQHTLALENISQSGSCMCDVGCASHRPPAEEGTGHMKQYPARHHSHTNVRRKSAAPHVHVVEWEPAVQHGIAHPQGRYDVND